MTSEVERAADDSPVPIPLETENLSLKPESVQPVADGESLCAERQEDGGAVLERLQVALAGEGAVYSDGAVRIPLEITLAGASRRLVVSIAIELA